MGGYRTAVKHLVEDHEIETIEVCLNHKAIMLSQKDDLVVITPAMIPALIEALQAAAKEAGNE